MKNRIWKRLAETELTLSERFKDRWKIGVQKENLLANDREIEPLNLT